MVSYTITPCLFLWVFTHFQKLCLYCVLIIVLGYRRDIKKMWPQKIYNLNVSYSVLYFSSLPTPVLTQPLSWVFKRIFVHSDYIKEYIVARWKELKRWVYIVCSYFQRRQHSAPLVVPIPTVLTVLGPQIFHNFHKIAFPYFYWGQDLILAPEV